MVLEALDEWHSANYLPDVAGGHVATHQADGCSMAMEKFVTWDDFSAELTRITDGLSERINRQQTRHGDGAEHMALRTSAEDATLSISHLSSSRPPLKRARLSSASDSE